MEYVRFYYHGISDNSLDCLESIFRNKAILSRSQMDREAQLVSKHEYIGYNGNNYISICEQYDNNGHITDCYEEYIRNNISLIIVNPTSIVKTTLVNCVHKQDYNNYQDYYNALHNSNNRYSDLTGEFQVYQIIPLKNVVAIAYPLTMQLNDIDKSYMNKYDKLVSIRDVIVEYRKLKLLLDKYNISKSVIDLENWQLVEQNLNNYKYRIMKR